MKTMKNFGSTAGLTRLKDDPSTPAKGMVAAISTAYASGFLPGDIRGAFITAADGVSETLVGSELVTNGTFDVDTAGWSAEEPAVTTLSVAGGTLYVDGGANAGGAIQAFSTVPGKTYVVTGMLAKDATAVLSAAVRVLDGNGALGVGMLLASFTSAATTLTLGSANFVALSNTSSLYLRGDTKASFDNISVREVIADRSVKNNGLVINGSLTKAPVAAGAGLCALSGFSATNYLERPYDASLDFGTGDFCVMGWLTFGATFTERALLALGDGVSIGSMLFKIDAQNRLALFIRNSTAFVEAVSYTDAGLAGTSFNCVEVDRRGSAVTLRINGRVVGTGTSALTVSNATAKLRVGERQDISTPHSGKLALWRISATAPSDDQLKAIYETEKKLFEPGAQCAIAGTSNAVTALAYDEDTDLLHVGTSWGRSAFQGLLRVSSEATPVGSIKALAASGGAVVQAGASAVDVYIPAYSLREELERLDDATRALGSVPVFHEFDAVTSQVDFVVPAGFRVVAVYSAGSLKREGTTKDWVRINDGFRETVRFAVAPGNGVWVSIMTVRA